MALGTPTEQATVNSGVDNTVYTTGSFTPPATTFLYLFFASGVPSGAEEPTLGGTLGLVWSKIVGAVVTSGQIRGTLWIARTTATPPTGTISFTHLGTHSWGMGFVGSISGVSLTNPIVQVGTPFITTTTDNPGITLPSAITAGNMTMGLNVWNRTFVLPPGTGYTAVDSAANSQSSPTGIVGAEYNAAGATLVDWTTIDDIQKALFAIEIGAAVLPTANAGNDQTNINALTVVTLDGSTSTAGG